MREASLHVTYAARLALVALTALGCDEVTLVDHWHCSASAAVTLAGAPSQAVEGGGNDDHFRSAASSQAVENCEAYVAQTLAAAPGSRAESPCVVTYCQQNPPPLW
jgi:hypothetical protein